MNQFLFNLNQHIKVKLTPLGYYRLAELHNEFIGRIPHWERRDWKYYEEHADKDGYTEFRMWDFMNKFGDVTTLGGPDYFDVKIIIEEQTLEMTNS